MLVNPHQLAEERSLAAHRLIAERLRENPELVLQARKRVADWAARGTVNSHYCQAWQEWLELPLPELLRRLQGTDEEARALRQVTPFAGVLSPRQRWRIWRSVREDLER